ncbi:MAG: beta-lactamase family protein [Bacteroidetes bacterium]|nr:beta-lactamase family protein [Bacteroidota bacterium]
MFPVKNSDVYDIASLTKIYSTALAAMYLVDKKKLDVDEKASHYLSSLRKSDKKDMTIRQLMAHEAGLKA